MLCCPLSIPLAFASRFGLVGLFLSIRCRILVSISSDGGSGGLALRNVSPPFDLKYIHVPVALYDPEHVAIKKLNDAITSIYKLAKPESCLLPNFYAPITGARSLTTISFSF